MNDRTLLLILITLATVAFAVGIWVGLGYPGLFDKYENTGKALALVISSISESSAS